MNSNNVAGSPRLVASKVNDLTDLLTSSRESLTMQFFLNTTDTKVSPMIDLDRVSIITTMIDLTIRLILFN